MGCLLTNGECFLINVDMSAKRAQSINVVTNLGGSLVSPEKLHRPEVCHAVRLPTGRARISPCQTAGCCLLSVVCPSYSRKGPSSRSQVGPQKRRSVYLPR